MLNVKLDAQTTTIAYGQDMTAVCLADENVQYAKCYGIQSVITDATPGADTFTADNATNIFTNTAHGYVTGMKCQVSTSGALPTGLSGGVDYYVIKIDADTFKLASSLANAQAGTAIDISDDGTGTQTLTPTALAGGSIAYHASIDGSTYVALASATNITGAVNLLVEKIDPAFKYIKCVYTLTAGQLGISQYTMVKGE